MGSPDIPIQYRTSVRKSMGRILPEARSIWSIASELLTDEDRSITLNDSYIAIDIRAASEEEKKEYMEKSLLGGDIVQITDNDHYLFGCLVIVSEIDEKGIKGCIIIPQKDCCKKISLSFEFGNFEKVGHAKIVG